MKHSWRENSTCAAERHIVDVVPGRLGQGAVLSPAGHPGVDQPRVAGQALVRSDPQPLGGAGPHALDEDVGGVEETQQCGAAVVVLEVQDDAALAASPGIAPGRYRGRLLRGPVDDDDVGTQVGKQHGSVRAGPE